MSNKKVVLFLPPTTLETIIQQPALWTADHKIIPVNNLHDFETQLEDDIPDLLIIGERLPLSANQENDEQYLHGIDLADRLLENYPYIPLLFFPEEHSASLAVKAFQAGFSDYLHPPVKVNEILQAINRALRRKERLEAWNKQETRRNTQSLQNRISSLETLQKIGRSVTASLDLDSVLTAVVDAAVTLTDAEEGSLLLLDDETGELYMYAARNFREEFVQTFRLPVQDTLPGEVLRSGKPLILNQAGPHKIKTSYLVRNLMYVPLIVKEHTIGVLGVDNRENNAPFTELHLTLVSALADYAAIAITNAQLYRQTEIERNKFENILTEIKDGVIVINRENRLMLINRTAKDIFCVPDINPIGATLEEAITSRDLLEIIQRQDANTPSRSEVSLEDGHTYSVQLTPISGVGLVATSQDITYLKELDQIKSDFVSTVSHDLRSPLTAILGYVELIDRVGPINEQQREFIRRIESSVQSITALINDLLDLGRIEAGFDTQKERIPLAPILQFTVNNLQSQAAEKHQSLDAEIPPKLPHIIGNTIRLRQMMENLIGNAIKYTQPGGKVGLRARTEGDQIIIQVIDNGPGIPPPDQPYIFDKFYRASNVAHEVPGTGLGLAIVKSIVENHRGRIWVESNPGRGTAFTVVLPVVEEPL